MPNLAIRRQKGSPGPDTARCWNTGVPIGTLRGLRMGARARITRRATAVAILACIVPAPARGAARHRPIRDRVPFMSRTAPLPWPRADVLGLALAAYECARAEG